MSLSSAITVFSAGVRTLSARGGERVRHESLGMIQHASRIFCSVVEGGMGEGCVYLSQNNSGPLLWQGLWYIYYLFDLKSRDHHCGQESNEFKSVCTKTTNRGANRSRMKASGWLTVFPIFFIFLYFLFFSKIAVGEYWTGCMENV